MSLISRIVASDLGALAARSEEIDCLVIGSGTSGVTTALTLADAGLRVVILEAGPYVLSHHIGTSPFRSREDIVPQIHDQVRYDTSWVTQESYERHQGGRPPSNNTAWSAAGGRTLFWGGCTPRFAPHCFSSWPFGYDEIEPFYLRAEQMIHVSGSAVRDHPPFYQSPSQDALIDRLNKAGILAEHTPLGVDTEPVLNGHVSRGFDSSIDRLLRSGHLRTDLNEPGVCLALDSIATRLVDSGDRVAAVEVRDKVRGRDYQLSPRHIVLCGGAVQSTRLVLSSGLDTDSPAVGRYINDHLFVQGVLRLRQPLEQGPIYIFLPETETQPFQVQMQGAFQETWYSPYHATVWLAPDADGIYVLFYCFGVSTVDEGSRVELLGSPDLREGGMRDYCVIYDRSPQDKAVIQSMIDFMPGVAEQMDAEVLRHQENPPGAALHEIGGLRMGNDPQTSVTNTQGRFWHYANLSAHDASIWPSQGAANSYLTITAVALRQSEILAADLAV